MLPKSDISRAILKIALPSIIANITTPLLGMVDLAIVGHLGNPAYIAAIALGGTIFSMIYWLFGFLRMGTSGITAQAFGRADIAERNATLIRALIVSFAIAIALIILSPLIKVAMLRFLDGDPDATALAARYFDILIFGAPATLGVYAFNGWFIGMQNSSLTMYTSLVINVVNIAASFLLVYVAGWGIAGVATGTLIAQWVGLFTAALLSRRYRPFESLAGIFSRNRSRSRLAEIFDRKQLGRFFTINRDIFLRTLCLVAVTVWFTRAGARQGDVILAVNALLMQLFYLFSYFIDGYAFAAEAIVGRLYGERRAGIRDAAQRYKAAVKSLFSHAAVLALIFTAIYFLAGDFILRLLSDQPSVIDAAADFKYWAFTIPLVGFAAFIYDGIFIGETRSTGMLLSMAAATAVFFATYFLASTIFSPSVQTAASSVQTTAPSLSVQSTVAANHSLWLAFILYLLTRALVQHLLHRRQQRP